MATRQINALSRERAQQPTLAHGCCIGALKLDQCVSYHAGGIVCAYSWIVVSPAEAACGVALQPDPMATAASAPAKCLVL